MNVGRFGFTLEGPLKHFLRCNIFTAIQFNYTAIVQRVSIAREHVLGAQTCFSYSKVGTSACGNFGNLGILFQKSAELITGFSEVTIRKFFVGVFERE
jgi:hypothetical protein